VGGENQTVQIDESKFVPLKNYHGTPRGNITKRVGFFDFFCMEIGKIILKLVKISNIIPFPKNCKHVAPHTTLWTDEASI
jgi:hypothetical protein